MRYLLLVPLLGLCTALTAQTGSNQSSLSIETIMQGDRFVGVSPSGIFWSANSEELYFNWNPELDTLSSRYRTDPSGSEPQKMSTEQQQAIIRPETYSEDGQQMLYTKFGDLYLLDLPSMQSERLLYTSDRESDPQFGPEEGQILFQRNRDLFLLDRKAGKVQQLVNFESGSPSSSRGNNQKQGSEAEQWLQQDQMELFETLRERDAEDELQEQRRSALRDNDQEMSPVYDMGKSLYGQRISPDLNYVSYVLRANPKQNRTMVPNFVTESGYIDELRARAKVGADQGSFSMGIYDRRRDTSYLIDIEQIPGIRDKPAYKKEYHEGDEAYQEQYEEARSVILHGPFYAESGRAAVVVRSLDNKDRWIMELDPATATLRLIDRQRDEAWIGGPGVGSYFYSAGEIGWIDDETLYFQSEETGYSHLYSYNVRTGQKKALTSGTFEVLDVSLSRDKSTFYLTANAESPFEHHFYHLPSGGGELLRISSLPGNNQVELSPDEQHLAIRYSYSNKPWELYLMDNQAGAEPVQITTSTTEEFQAYDWREPEIIRFQASDGVEVPARLYRPENAQPDGPAVIFVHGAGYLQNVHRWWSSYYREYMFHNLLVDNGYTVLDIDYRGSAGYGRDWRTAIYRHMGGRDLGDQIDGAAHLVDAYDIDAERIGIYGGSYGGFMTLMALFTSPGTFKAGAALRSVTDWAHYNHPYTSNILNTAVEDSLAYQQSSPIYFAEGLKDHLLILHGMIDTNVQFQDVVRLSQRLIELGKDNWEFAVFPLEGHGFQEPSSWTDEYKRIYKLFEQQLK